MLKKDFTSEQLLIMAREVSSYNGMFEEIGYAYDDLNEFLDTYFPKSSDAIRAWHYGNANYTDDYFRINVYGNIESLSEYELLDECEDNRDDIVEEYVRLVQENNINDDEGFIDDELLEELGYLEDNEEE